MIKSNVLFLAPYPTSKNIREGMMQRVAAIDKIFCQNNYEKIYLTPRFKTLQTRRSRVFTNTEEINLSIWTSFILLIKELKKADVIYCHSLYGIGIIGILILPFYRSLNIVWDVHGIIPEELKLAEQSKLKQLVYSFLERIIVKKSTKIIVVTNAMKDHLCKKYKKISAEFFVYPILPNTIKDVASVTETINNRNINIIYAGNTQGYQNIPMMISSIKEMIKVPNINFFILTGEKEKMYESFKLEGLANETRIYIDSVNPEELFQYYEKAHYGYILRDNIEVNNVACPTKIIEYLAYGITCITISPNIGDFNILGFDYININDLKKHELRANKSKRNQAIYNRLIADNTSEKLISFIYGN